MKNSCDYYKPKKADKTNCPNCKHWGGTKCKIEEKVKQINQTALIHEPVRSSGRFVLR